MTEEVCCTCNTAILCKYVEPYFLEFSLFLGFCFRFDMMGIMLLYFIVPVLSVCILLIFSYTFGHGNSMKFDLLFIGGSICSNMISCVALLSVHLVVFI